VEHEPLRASRFLQGKTIRLVIGYSAGGTNDLWARAIARFWGKYIPGNPDIIVQNMPGAATMIAVNYIYGVGKADGLTVGSIAPALFSGTRDTATTSRSLD